MLPNLTPDYPLSPSRYLESEPTFTANLREQEYLFLKSTSKSYRDNRMHQSATLTPLLVQREAGQAQPDSRSNILRVEKQEVPG